MELYQLYLPMYHYQKNHTINFNTWLKYRRLFTKVYNAYKDSKEEQKTFVSEQDLRSYLLNNGVSISDGEVYIVVKSGLLKTIITTSYKDFSNQLENIRIALFDYKYKLDVQL